jgi:diacylglycerol kinase (ATP)
MKEIMVIANPVAGHGNGAKVLPALRHYLTEGGLDFDLVCTTRPLEAIELAKQAAADGYRTTVAAGGDGTVHEVLNGLRAATDDNQVAGTLGIIPIGSGNDIAHMVGIPENLLGACRCLAEGQNRVIDMGRLDDRYFANNIGMGFDAMVSIVSRRIRYLHGFPMYFLAVLQTVFIYYKAPTVSITHDDQTTTQPILMATIGNGTRHGGGFFVTPLAEVDDGWLDLCIAREVSRPRIFALIPHFMRGTHVDKPPVTMLRCKRAVVTCDSGLAVHVDGEIYAEAARRLEIEILPRQLRVVCGSANGSCTGGHNRPKPFSISTRIIL